MAQEESQQQKKGLFSHKQQPQKQEEFPSVDMGSLQRRLRSAEEAITNMRHIVQVTDENMLVKHRHFLTEFKTLTSDLNEIRQDLQDLREKLRLVMKEMQNVARKQDVQVIERYVNMWDPMKFVTHGELEMVVKEVVKQILSEQKPKRPGSKLQF